MLDEDPDADDAVKNTVLDALDEVGDTVETQAADAPTGTFLKSISVAGFRGIGRQARLELYPAPGLTVVSGRNGSGKSSFSEALELALTGTSYRWRQKSSLWAETWRNLHHSDPCAIRVELIADGIGQFRIGLDWTPHAELADRTSWTQGFGSEQRIEGTEQLGWDRSVELWRPILSYDELGRLFEGGPSALYDALDKLLGLDALADAEKLLAAKLKDTKSAREAADATRKQLQTALADIEDERAKQADKLLRKRPVPLDEVLALATGADAGGAQAGPGRFERGHVTRPERRPHDVGQQTELALQAHTVGRDLAVGQQVQAQVDVVGIHRCLVQRSDEGDHRAPPNR